MKQGDIKLFFRPAQPLSAAILALCVIATANFGGILSVLANRTQVDTSLLTTTTKAELERLSQNIIVSKLTLIIFWGAVGFIAYTLIWGFYNAAIEARNEAVMETSYTNKGHWFVAGLRAALIQIGLAAVLIGCLFLAARIVFPWSSLLAGILISQDFSWARLAFAIAGWGVLAINLLICWLVAKFMFTLH